MDSSIISVESSPAASVSTQPMVKDDLSPLAGFLNSDLHADSDRLQEIVNYFRAESKEFSEIDLLNAVRSLETKLGAPRLGEKRIDQVHAYVKLQRQIDVMSHERDALLR